MDDYMFKATNLIAETFEKYGIVFKVEDASKAEIITAGFHIDGGPSVSEWFISSNDNNDVAVRIFGLITNTPEAKRPRVMEACNILNCEVRHLKFYMDDGNVNIDYDFPECTPDEGVGKMALEIFFRTMKTLDEKYGIFMKAIYTDEELVF